ncbi:hypothetical protein MJG53_013307 [Ovis ammon polii x Ovis aries]|uniref:Uncharacterized protein n=1 Tax=Ovis ammon polii x Ovis aries TaxID=2918886 RepID=A0ACB9UJ45_9CETA|nr:hypothetical protein MJG53_013307 [Ovis ammon polii x Ovis aries]
MSQAPGAQPSPPSVYHERQRLELCAVHALNNVLQQQLFSQEAADEICKRLAPDSRLNPHRSLLGTGNYDVNVIMAALQGQGLAAVWWDRRRPLSQLALPKVLGLILNLPSPVSLGLLSLPLRRRHWVALRQVDGVYYNLDSKLRAPEVLGDEDGVRRRGAHGQLGGLHPPPTPPTRKRAQVCLKTAIRQDGDHKGASTALPEDRRRPR